TIGSHALLLQLATNLVHNAIVHNLPQRGSVWVTTSVRPDRAVLNVENTGENLAPNIVATLAEPFQRGTERIRTDYAGVGLELEGQATIEGEWAGRVTGLGEQHVEIAMMRTPDGHSRLELSRFLTPPVVADHRNAPVNALGYLRVMFAVDDIDNTLARLRKHGAELVSSEVVQYKDAYRLCYIRGPEGLLIGLAQELG